MPILTQTFMNDRLFYSVDGQIWERRWIGWGWQWFHHSFLSDSIGNAQGEVAELGPLLTDNAGGWSRLMVSTGLERHQQQSPFRVETFWYSYTFNPAATSFASISDFSVPGQQPIDGRWLPISSGLTADAGQAVLYGFGHNKIGTGWLTSFDNSLSQSGQSSGLPINVTTVSEAYIKGMRPGVMSNHDVFFIAQDAVYHANINLGLSYHPMKGTNVGVSPGYSQQVFSMDTKGRLTARRFDKGKQKWVTDKHGRPVAGRHFKKGDDLRPNSMRKLNNDKLIFIVDTSWSSPRIYERHRDSTGWHWADHGHNANDEIVDIGPGTSDTYFVVTNDNRLVQNHWRSDLKRWAWFDHGRP